MESSIPGTKTLVQCDFDGTITQDDVSFLLLDARANGDWRQILEEYKAGKIPVGEFNTRAFALVRADRQTLVDLALRTVKIRKGFDKLVAHCRDKGLRLVIVSNGLDFYIKAILDHIGINGIDVFAAETAFSSDKLDVRYIGPDGVQLHDGFKEAHTRLFLDSGYRVIYIGNGPSDLPPARLAHRIFAIDGLLAMCNRTGVSCTPFIDFNDVIKNLDN